jgi:hypothetical protein
MNVIWRMPTGQGAACLRASVFHRFRRKPDFESPQPDFDFDQRPHNDGSGDDEAEI